MAEVCTFYSYSHYITESERAALEEKYTALNQDVSAIISCKELEESPQKDSFLRFHKAMSDTKGHKKANNDHFIENQLKGCVQYFDTVLAYPLDQQQREAVVSLEDNVLVISSAGSIARISPFTLTARMDRQSEYIWSTSPSMSTTAVPPSSAPRMNSNTNRESNGSASCTSRTEPRYWRQAAQDSTGAMSSRF